MPVLFPKILKKPEGKKILVLSPHPDDDVLGCGGSLALYPKEVEITVLYFSDGSRGTIDRHKDKGLIEIRHKEAEKAGRILGVKRQIFLDLPDLEFKPEKESVLKLASILKEIEPDSIYLPFFLDGHRDHREVSIFLTSACNGYKKEPKLYTFGIWTPPPPNLLVDISPVVKKKKEAILAHKSQLKNRNYLKAIFGLNQYFGNLYNAGQYAEGFWACSLRDYLSKMRECV